MGLKTERNVSRRGRSKNRFFVGQAAQRLTQRQSHQTTGWIQGFAAQSRLNIRAVVIVGQVGHQTSSEPEAKSLEPSSYFGGKGESVHRISSTTSGESIIYIHTGGNYELVSE